MPSGYNRQLVVMIPCLNEEKTLAKVLSSIPKQIKEISEIKILVVDDGSTDKTGKIAADFGATVIKHTTTRGLAYSFSRGLEKALEMGADIIVNTDGDNQYPQEEIPKLIKPIIEEKADLVIADRQTDKIPHFSLVKKILQKLGSFLVKTLSGTEVADTSSGFRAFSRNAALNINIFTDYTYTIETIIAAGKKKMKIVSIPVTVNPKTRESRLMKSMYSYLKISASTIVRVFAIYEPLKTFGLMGVVICLPGLFFIVRFLYFFSQGHGNGHVQSLVIGTLITLVGFQIALFGIIADLIGFNRRLLEQIKSKVKS
jgi:glycosyltransferase involved in cell wall biosynthesis